jgi:secondary thiamine-phosphate synthase enzyme
MARIIRIPSPYTHSACARNPRRSNTPAPVLDLAPRRRIPHNGGMHTFTLQTRRRTQFVNITAQVESALRALGIRDGAVTVFVPHTTAGVTINENADPDVTADLTDALDRIAPWSAGYRHAEGNAAAHVKASLMGASAHLLVRDGALCLGTWQGIYFCEFDGPRTRTVWVG